MKYFSVDDISRYVSEWFKQKLTTDMIPYLSQGGWEGWVQVELAMFCGMLDFDIQREQKIYGDDRSRVDLLFNNLFFQPDNNQAHDDLKRIAVEIKCQSVYYDTSGFINAVNSDICKLRTLDSALYTRCILLFLIEKGSFNHFSQRGFFTLCGNENIVVLAKLI